MPHSRAPHRLDVSEALRKVKEVDSDLVREAFEMNARDPNLGAAEPTYDYWRGDEDKWIETFLAGLDAVFADNIKFDESNGQSRTQVSVAIKDPQPGQAGGTLR